MGVLAGKFPNSIRELLAYMITTMKAEKEYEEPAWRVYDQAFRDKAAAVETFGCGTPAIESGSHWSRSLFGNVQPVWLTWA